MALRVGDLLAPQPSLGRRGQHWSVILRARVLEQPSKVGEYDGTISLERDENQKKPLVNRRDALAFFSLGAAIASVTQEAEPALALQDLDNVGSLGNAILQAQPAEKPSAPPPAAAPTGNKGGKAAPEPYAGGKKKMKWQMNAEETPKVKVEGQEDDAMMIAKQRRQEKREAQEEKSKARKKNCTYIEKMNGTGGC